VITYEENFTPFNALRIISEGWEIIMDASDNAPTRYLISDAAVISKIPLVSGSAI
jgi:adenylyltransferase/sulfurtransferase